MKIKKYVPRNRFEAEFHCDYVRLRKMGVKKAKGRLVKFTSRDITSVLTYIFGCRKRKCSAFLPPGYWLVRWMMIYEGITHSRIDLETIDKTLVEEAFLTFCKEGNVRQCASLVMTSLWVGLGFDLSVFGNNHTSKIFLQKVSRQIPKLL
jgi:hypothetical protein